METTEPERVPSPPPLPQENPPPPPPSDGIPSPPQENPPPQEIPTLPSLPMSEFEIYQKTGTKHQACCTIAHTQVLRTVST